MLNGQRLWPDVEAPRAFDRNVSEGGTTDGGGAILLLSASARIIISSFADNT